MTTAYKKTLHKDNMVGFRQLVGWKNYHRLKELLPMKHGDGNSLPSHVPAALLGRVRGGDGLGHFRNVSETAGTAKVFGDM